MGSEILEQAGLGERVAFTERAVLTPEEAAHYCGMTPDLFWSHVRAGRVKFVNLSTSPARVRTGPRLAGFRRSTLDEFLARLEVEFPQDQSELAEAIAVPAATQKRGKKAAKPGGSDCPAEPPIKTWS